MDIDIKYTFQSYSKNYIFYKCTKRPECNGRAKLNLKNKDFSIIEKCNKEIKHDNVPFELFFEKYKNKKFDNINFENKKYHRYYIKSMIKTNEFTDIPNAIKAFKKDTGYLLLLKKDEINVLKSQLTDNFNNLDLLGLINQIKDISYELEYKTIDIKYAYKNKNKTEEREEKIIAFGTKETLKNLDKNNNKEFFIDSTFRIIPNKYKPYKLLTISTYNQKDNLVKFCCFIAYKFQDIISYERIIGFLKEHYNFFPTIIHTDYEFALYKAFDNKNLYEKGVIHIFCYFHYIKAIKEKMKSLKLIKKLLDIKSYEILKNIEIISFIKEEKLKD